MKKEKDAFGRICWEYYNRRPVFEMIERDDGYIDLGGIGLQSYFTPHRGWPAYQRRAMGAARGKVLDIGCGPGRVCLHLQKKKCNPLGIDVSPLALKVARALGVKKTRQMPIGDITRFKTGQFNTIVMYGNNFGLFGKPARCRRLLKTMHRITAPGAVILAESLNPKTSMPAHKKYQAANVAAGRWRGELRIRMRWHQYVGDWIEYMIVSEQEMRKLLQDTGWVIRKIYKDKGPMYVAEIHKI